MKIKTFIYFLNFLDFQFKVLIYFFKNQNVCNEGPRAGIWENHKTKFLEALKFGLMKFGVVFLLDYS